MPSQKKMMIRLMKRDGMNQRVNSWKSEARTPDSVYREGDRIPTKKQELERWRQTASSLHNSPELFLQLEMRLSFAFGKLAGFAEGQAWVGEGQPGDGGVRIIIKGVALLGESNVDASAVKQVQIAVKTAHVQLEALCEIITLFGSGSEKTDKFVQAGGSVGSDGLGFLGARYAAFAGHAISSLLEKHERNGSPCVRAPSIRSDGRTRH
jgi:hypothetical protein